MWESEGSYGWLSIMERHASLIIAKGQPHNALIDPMAPWWHGCICKSTKRGFSGGLQQDVSSCTCISTCIKNHWHSIVSFCNISKMPLWPKNTQALERSSCEYHDQSIVIHKLTRMRPRWEDCRAEPNSLILQDEVEASRTVAHIIWRCSHLFW